MTKRKTTVSPSREPVETTDLTKAAYLIAIGHVPELFRAGVAESGQPLGGWRFPCRDGIGRDAREFDNGSSAVEPRAFYRSVVKTRRELFKFLDIGDNT
jgi:hypothetical protein